MVSFVLMLINYLEDTTSPTHSERQWYGVPFIPSMLMWCLGCILSAPIPERGEMVLAHTAEFVLTMFKFCVKKTKITFRVCITKYTPFSL
jgi:hypothetical protein